MSARANVIEAYLQRQAAPAAIDGRRQIARYFVWLPALWLLGIHVILMAVLVMRLAVRRWPTDPLVNLLFGLWCLAAVAQAIAVIYNWSLLGEGLGQLLGRLITFTILGWVFLGLALAVGRSWNFAGPTMVRSFMVLGLWFACLTVFFYALAFATGLPSLYISTPVHMVFGGPPIVDFYTLAIPFHPKESSFGLVRLVLFYPWSTCLSLMGIITVLVATCETDSRWRAIGVAGGLCAVAFSFSRAGYATFPVALAATLILRGRPTLMLSSIITACALALVFVILEIRPDEVVGTMIAEMRASRSGSSQARDLVYEASWLGFLDSPVFGKGWIGGSVIPEVYLPIGSHSTFFGVLYQGGASTFACVAIAGLATLFASVVNAIRTRSPAAAAGAGTMVALFIFSYGEGLSTLILPMLAVFLFVGGSLSHHPEVES